MKTSLRRAGPGGFTLVELLIVLAVSAVLLFVTVRAQFASREADAVKSAADRLTQLGVAVQSYIANNSGQTGILYTMAGNTRSLGIAALKAGTSCGTNPCLAADFVNVAPGSAAGNGYTILIRRLGAAPAYQYEAVIVTNEPWVVGSSVRLDLAGAAAAKIGGSGLVSYTTTGMELAGEANSSAAPAATSTNYPAIDAIGLVGYMVSSTTTNANDNIYLRRDGLYPMTGNLQMGGNNLTGATNIGAATVTASGNVTSGGQVQGATVASTGAMTSGGAFTANSTSTFAGAITANSTLTTAGTVTMNGNLSTNGVVNAFGNVNLRATTTVTAAGDLLMNGLVGTNKSLSDRVPRAVPAASFPYTISGTATVNIAQPTCGANSSPRIQITNNTAIGTVDGGNWGSVVTTTISGTNWVLSMTKAPRSPGPTPAPTANDSVTGVAVTYCYYP